MLTVTLEEFEKPKDTWSMSEDEKLEWGTSRKEMGSSLLKAGRLGMALQRYKKVIDAFSYVDNMQEENKVKAKALKVALRELWGVFVSSRVPQLGQTRSGPRNNGVAANDRAGR